MKTTFVQLHMAKKPSNLKAATSLRRSPSPISRSGQLTLCCVAFCGILVGTQPLKATPPTPIGPGIWEGTVKSNTSVGPGTVSLKISSVEERRFEGTIAVQTPNQPIIPANPSDGTVSDSGEINIESGDDDSEFFFEAHGQITGKTMSLTYHIKFSDGTSDTGTMSLVPSGVVIGGGTYGARHAAASKPFGLENGDP